MQIRVRLFATLRHYLPQDEPGAFSAVDLPEGATVAGLLARLGVPEDEAKIVFVNGHSRPLNWALAVGDEVGVFPPIGGG